MQQGIIKFKTILSGSNILKPNFHLNYGKKRIDGAINNNKPFKPLGEITANIYTGGIFKRLFVVDRRYGIPYLSAQFMMNYNPLDVAKLISKKYTPRQEDMTLRSNQILVSCAGTVGNVKLIGQDLDGVIGSQDIIRIIGDNNSTPFGYIYAYLMTETAYSYMQSFIYGSVVPRIEPNTLASLPVPILPKPSQQKIHDLIVEASALRVEANNLISNLVDKVNSLLGKEYGDFKKNNSCIRSIKKIKELEKRFDAPYNAGLGRSIYDKITETKFVTLSSISEVFHPMLFGKKQLKGLETKGNPLYKSSSMMKMKPETDFWLSLKKTDVYSKLQVKEGWVLISRTGTVGNVVRINASMNNVFIDDHMIRVKPKQEYSGLVYIYLKSFYGQKLIEFQKYGSVQEVINSEYIERIPIPLKLFEKDVLDELNKNVAIASSKIDRSIANENIAVNLIEKEIESWQK